ncbi:HAD family hydrolase [Swingsia samuiensis]|uniref:Haloacid dehalogenase-like hydrolase n=1 Tax=Swingsia samuiensis TaxID=1293412 RepID=A0A4Y6UIG7_9PROT|nr:HAD family hydrolase [Swingsia samuiensis]QDH16256.1 haloacid dehalogenase-like hydrolase [Swingsia samuiensis]
MSVIDKRTAIIYDFDGTLAKGNLQETSFIPQIGMEKKEFWEEVKNLTRENNADEILVYMHLMLEKANKKNIKISANDFNKHGRKAALFPGLGDSDWFKRVNEHAKDLSLNLEHYIISSGIEEMIRGCSISNEFKNIFASKFIYNKENQASWPGVGINYTTKTQYLFRINKGIDNHWDNNKINKFIPESERKVPFERMIFIGDGETDIPTMKMLSYKGGHSIAVYDSATTQDDLKKIHDLISTGRVDFVAPADYQKNSPLEIIVKGILSRIAFKN